MNQILNHILYYLSICRHVIWCQSSNKQTKKNTTSNVDSQVQVWLLMKNNSPNAKNNNGH